MYIISLLILAILGLSFIPIMQGIFTLLGYVVMGTIAEIALFIIFHLGWYGFRVIQWGFYANNSDEPFPLFRNTCWWLFTNRFKNYWRGWDTLPIFDRINKESE